MGELKATSAFDGLLPLNIGQATLSDLEAGTLTSITALGDVKDMGAALEKSHGMALPKPNRATGKDGGRCLWFGRGEVLLMGPTPDASLAKHGAVVDVSDGWAAALLEGPAAADVLARLVPADLRDSQFKRGHSLRTQMFHMQCSLTRLGPEKFMILVFRSMTATLVHDLKAAMAAVASRG
ncbi:MAG: sarcosine oxidase subunit gamma [Sulfitobacter sp.]